MKYEEPNMEIVLIYGNVITSSLDGPLEWEEGGEYDDSGDLDGLN